MIYTSTVYSFLQIEVSHNKLMSKIGAFPPYFLDLCAFVVLDVRVCYS